MSLSGIDTGGLTLGSSTLSALTSRTSGFNSLSITSVELSSPVIFSVTGKTLERFSSYILEEIPMLFNAGTFNRVSVSGTAVPSDDALTFLLGSSASLRFLFLLFWCFFVFGGFAQRSLPNEILNGLYLFSNEVCTASLPGPLKSSTALIHDMMFKKFTNAHCPSLKKLICSTSPKIEKSLRSVSASGMTGRSVRSSSSPSGRGSVPIYRFLEAPCFSIASAISGSSGPECFPQSTLTLLP
ncbi:hypothetical protein OGAPHI_005671 [Ogataea philodendri]|uniref:Uncharacterized protein n=1 Tax=Ogataea philodendri TaxID=1378263 RepID=A0A9P8T1R7_9ASCO|nr:uncharacterized protein OGAPHI_005671 [Ogataea philodendri]KAH3662419.1 hypothetical protein OGAPHI_005671 [Ogataea philodendri]